jgi:hypothetical protein
MSDDLSDSHPPEPAFFEIPAKMKKRRKANSLRRLCGRWWRMLWSGKRGSNPQPFLESLSNFADLSDAPPDLSDRFVNRSRR